MSIIALINNKTIKYHFATFVFSFFSGIIVALAYYNLSSDGLMLIGNDLSERFGVPISGFNVYVFFYVFVDYVIFSLTITTVYYSIYKEQKIKAFNLFIHGLFASLLLLISHQILLSITFVGTYYFISFFFALSALIKIFFFNKKCPVTHKMYAFTTVILYLFIVLIHVVCIYGSLFNQVDTIKAEEDQKSLMIVSIIKFNDIDALDNLYGDMLSVTEFTWRYGSEIPADAKSKKTIKNVLNDMPDDSDWSIVFNYGKYETSGEFHLIDKVTRHKDEIKIVQHEIKTKRIAGVYFEYYKLIYYFIISFIIVWLSGLFKVIKIHGNL